MTIIRRNIAAAALALGLSTAGAFAQLPGQ
jgi:hypothetical protein